MKFRHIYVCLLILLCPIFFFGQIKVSDFQSSSVAEETDNKLYFLDFWATWCMPCIHVSKYLTSLQKEFPKDFYIVSLTQENPDIVDKFLEKHSIPLAIAIDYEGQTFKKNNIYSLPHGILYNANGTKLWEGHPAELKSVDVSKFLKRNNKRIAVNKMFTIGNYNFKQKEKLDLIVKDFDYFKLQERSIRQLQIIYAENFIELIGSLQDILSYSDKVYKSQIIIPDSLNETYKIRFKNNTDAINNMSETILVALELNKTLNKIRGEVLVFEIKKPTFWDTNQIDWGNNNEKYLINDSEIKADNVSIKEVVYTLSNVLEKPIVLSNNSSGNVLHDWQIHYKYFDLMVSNLSDYGVEIKKEIIKYPHYIITKKVP